MDLNDTLLQVGGPMVQFTLENVLRQQAYFPSKFGCKASHNVLVKLKISVPHSKRKHRVPWTATWIKS